MAKGSKRLVSVGVWQLRVGAGKDPVTGRYLSAQETFRGTEAKAERRLRELVKAADRARDDGPATMTTLSDLLDAWWPSAQASLSPSTVRNQTWLIDSVIKPRLGGVALARLDAATIDRFYGLLSASGGASGGPLAPGTVRRIHNVLSSALARAVKWGWLTRNPASQSSPPALVIRDIEPPSAEQVAAIIEESAEVNSALPLYFRIAAVTGARRSEVVALRWSDVDFATATLRIAHGVVVGPDRAQTFKDTKTHAARSIALDDSTLAELAAHRDEQTRIASELAIPSASDGFVFTHEPDASAPWSPEYVSRAFDRIKRRLGYKSLRLHDFRHFTATTMLANGTDVRTVAGRLGHRNVSVTLNTYSHFVPAKDRDAADFLGKLF